MPLQSDSQGFGSDLAVIFIVISKYLYCYFFADKDIRGRRGSTRQRITKLRNQ